MPALGHNLPTVLLGRFFGGLFGVAPVAIFGGVISDCWPMAHRGIAMALAVSLVFSGPTFGPVFGGFIMSSSTLDWRWNMWVVIIVGLGASLLCAFAYPETYAPVILRKKGQALRRKTGNLDIKTAADKEGISLQEIARAYLIRPFCGLLPSSRAINGPSNKQIQGSSPRNPSSPSSPSTNPSSTAFSSSSTKPTPSYSATTVAGPRPSNTSPF